MGKQRCSVENKAKKKKERDNLEQSEALAEADLLGSDLAKSSQIWPRSQEFKEKMNWV